VGDLGCKLAAGGSGGAAVAALHDDGVATGEEPVDVHRPGAPEGRSDASEEASDDGIGTVERGAGPEGHMLGLVPLDLWVK
jgi:hypothetical protein